MPKGIDRIAFAFVIAFVEGQKESVFTIEFGGHIDLIGICGEVYEASPKIEQGLLCISLEFVLILPMHSGILPCPSIF